MEMIEPDITIEENKQELDNKLNQGRSNTLDPITALGAVPGTGMTDPKGEWQWEQPPLITDPDQAVDAVMDQFEEESNKTNILKLLVAGVSVEEIVSITLFNAFSEGKFTPDVAELIKPALTVGLITMADENNVPFRVFAEEKEDTEISDVETLKIMQSRNPEIYQGIKEDLNAKIREGRNPKPPEPQPVPKQLSEQNFLEMGVQQ